MYLNEIKGKGGMYAKMVADSVANGVRLSTLELCYPRFIHSEFMTHRVFSRNASSSRAIPVAKMIEQVEYNPAMPIHWGKNKPGMQAEEENDNVILWQDEPYSPQAFWRIGSEFESAWAEAASAAGYHKQVVNRRLEADQFIKVVVTATEWDNFFTLRLDKAAQPEIQELARLMKESMDKSVPSKLGVGEYHLPYIDSSAFEADLWVGLDTDCPCFDYEKALKASVARCARVSYLNHDKSKPDVAKDIALYDMLLREGHMSPFEHVASPMRPEVFDREFQAYFVGEGYYADTDAFDGVTHFDMKGQVWSGNFKGWRQHRQVI